MFRDSSGKSVVWNSQSEVLSWTDSQEGLRRDWGAPCWLALNTRLDELSAHGARRGSQCPRGTPAHSPLSLVSVSLQAEGEGRQTAERGDPGSVSWGRTCW